VENVGGFGKLKIIGLDQGFLKKHDNSLAGLGKARKI